MLKDMFAELLGLTRPHPHIPDRIVDVFIQSLKDGLFLMQPRYGNCLSFCQIYGETFDFDELMDIKNWKEKYEVK